MKKFADPDIQLVELKEYFIIYTSGSVETDDFTGNKTNDGINTELSGGDGSDF